VKLFGSSSADGFEEAVNGLVLLQVGRLNTLGCGCENCVGMCCAKAWMDREVASQEGACHQVRQQLRYWAST
jgi:hypothetical protein